MTAARLDLFLEQGAVYVKNLLRKNSAGPISTVGYTAKMQIRSDFGGTLILELLSSGGTSSIALGGVAGTIDLRIGADKTALYSAPEDQTKLGVYDLEITETADPTNIKRLIRGTVYVSPGVTQ